MEHTNLALLQQVGNQDVNEVTGSGHQLRPAEPPGDADADVDGEDEDSVNEVAVEDIRPRPQGSSPVYEYSIEEDYLKLQEENKKYSTGKSKQSNPQETMEVTLKTEVEAGASGFSVMGGGNEGIFIKKVIKESPASKIFSLREGDQLLSATIFFDNIKYEDALKILQYSEPYRVQFSLKRKIAAKEEPEHIQSTTQYKKERISQERDLSERIHEETLHVAGKAISEEDRETLIVSQRVGRSKRPKKDRLSWPKFQSIKNKKILGHRRSHSTSDAYDSAMQDISPTSTDTESQFQQEVHIKGKKRSQKKLKFPSIGFKMHRSKPEPQDKQKKEIKTTLLSEKEKKDKEDISLENPEILTVEYTTSPAYEITTGEKHETLTKEFKDMKNVILSHAKKCPEVEISIKTDKESTSAFTLSEEPSIKTQIPKPSLETAKLKESPTKQMLPGSSKSRKKKQKETEGASGINIHMKGHTLQESIEQKDLEIGTAKAELHTTSGALETRKMQAEDETQILAIQKQKIGILMSKKKEQETEKTKLESDVPHSAPEKKVHRSSDSDKNSDVKPQMPDAQTEESTWKIPSFKIPKTHKPDTKLQTEESTVGLLDIVKKEQIEDGMTTSDEKFIAVKTGEKDIEGKESKFRLPKFKLPTFTWAKDGMGQIEGQISDREETVPSIEGTKPEKTISVEEVKITGTETEVRIPKEILNDKRREQSIAVKTPSQTSFNIKRISSQIMEDMEDRILITKADIEINKAKFSMPSKESEDTRTTEENIKAPKMDMILQAPEVTLSLEGEAKTSEKEAGKTKDGKFKMPKFGMPSFGWSSSREAKGSAAADADVSLKEPQVTVASGSAEVDVSMPGAEIQVPGVEVTVETAAGGEGEKGRFKMPSVKLPKVKAPHVQVSLPKAEGSAPKAQAEVQEGEVAPQAPDVEGGLEVAAGKVEGGGMKLHMPKVKVPSVVFSKPTVKAPKVDASLPEVELKAGTGDITITAPDIQLPSVEASLELQAPETDLKASAAEAALDGAKLEATGLKGKLKMPKFDKPKFGVSLPKAEGPEGEGSLPTVEVDLPSATVTAAGEGPALGLQADVPAAKTDGEGWKLEKPSLKMPKADIKAPKVDISLPSVDVSLPKASVDLQAPEATLSLEGEAKTPEKEAGKTKDGKFKMPKFGMPSFGWSSSREAKGSAAADADVSLKEPQVTVASGSAEVDVSMPGAEIQVPGVEVTVETAAGGEGEKGRFKMPSVKLPKVKAPHVQVSLPKAEGSAPKAQAEVQEGEVAPQAPDVEGGLEVAAGKVEGGGMKLHMPKVKVPSVVFSKPTVKAPKVDASLPEVELKAGTGDITITAPDIQLPSVEASLELQAPETDLKASAAEAALDGAKLEATGLKGKLKMPKFDKPKFGVSLPKAEGPEGEGSLPTVEVDLPSATVTAAGEGPALGLQADVPAAKTDGEGWKLEKPSLKMPKADIKAPKVDISLPSVDVSLPKASVDLQAPEATLSLEGEAKTPEKEAGKTKDGKFKMPKFGMPSFGWSSSREAKGSAAADADVSLKEPQVTVASGSAEVDVSMPGAEIQVPGVEVTVETAAGGEGEKGRFKMPSVKLPKVKAPHVQVSLPKAEGSAPKAQAEVQEGEVAPQAPDVEGGLEVAAGKVEGGGMKLHMPKVKVPSVVFSKPTVKAPKVDASLPEVELKAGTGDITITAPDIQLPSVEASLELQAPETDLKASAAEAALDGAKLEATGLKGKLKMPKFDKPKFGVSLPKAEGPEGEGSLPTIEVDLPSATVTAAGEGPALGLQADVPAAKTDGEGWKLEKPSLKMPKADIKAPKVDISLPSVDVSLPKASVDLQAPEATLSLEGEAKTPEKEAGKTKDGKFKMPKFGMPSFGWSSSREVKGSAAADADVSLKEPQVTVASGSAEVDVSMPGAEMQVPGVEVTVETAAGGEGEKGRFKMPSVKLPKVKAPHVQVSLPKAEGSAPKAQAEVQEGEVAPQAPDVEGGLEVAAGKVEGGGMKLHMPKVKVPSVVFSKPTVKAPKVDASLPEVELKAGTGDITITAPDIQLPSVEASLELQAPETDLKASAAEAALDGAKLEATGLKGKLKMPKFDKPKFGVSLPKAEGPEGEGSLPTVEVDLPSATVTAAGEGPALGLQADVPAAKTDGEGWKLEKPSLNMPKADIKAPKVDISLPSVDVSLPKASVDLQAPEATLSLEGEAKTSEKEAGKTKDGKFKMPKFGMPSFGWSSSREAKGSAAADADVSLKEPQVTVASGSAEVDVSMPGAEIQVPGVEVTVETAAGGEGEKGRFKMPSVKLPKVKAPHVQVSLPKAEGSAPKAQAEVQEGEVAPQAPDVEGGLEVAAGKVEGGGMKLHMPKVKVPSVVFSKPTVKAPKVDASLPEVELKAGTGDITITAPDIQLPSVEASLELQAPETDLKASAAEAALDGAKLEATGLKGKLKMPKFDKPKFGVSLPKAEGPEGEGSLPTVEVDLPSATVTAAGEGPALGLQADVPAAKTDGEGWKLEKPSLKMPKADIKAPKVDISLPSVDVSLPKASVDLQAPEATLSLEGEAKTPEKEAGKTKDGKFKMPKFGMPSFGWSSSREAKGSAAADADVSLKEPQVTVASGSAEVDVSMPGAEIQVPGVEVTVETAAGGEGEKGRFKMPSVKLPKVKAPHVQVSLPKAEGSAPKAQAEVQEGEVAPQAPDVEGGLEVAAGKVEGGGMKLHMPKVKVPSVVFSKPTVKAPKVDASLPEVELKAGTGDITITAPDIQLPSVEASLELQAPETDLKASAAEAALDGAKLEATGLKGKLKMPKFDKPKFGVSLPKAEGPEGEGSLPTVEVDLPSATVTAAGEGPALGLQADVPAAKTDGEGWKLEKPSLKMPKADIKAPKVDISLPSVDVSLPKASVDLQAPEATLSLEGEAKTPEKEAGKTKDGKFKMPKFGMPSFGWSSSREAKGSAAADADVSLKEPQVTVASGSAEVDVSMPGAEIQVPGVEVTVETAAGGEGEKGRFKMPSVKLPKVKAPHVQVSLPKAEGSAPKAQAEVQEGEVAPQAPDVEGGLEVAAGKVEGGGMKLHMPKVKVPSVVFSKPTVKAPKVDASLPEVELKAGTGDITITAPDIQLPSVEASLELQAPETDLKASAAEAALDGAKLEATGLKGKLKMPKFDKPKFGVSLPKAEGPEGEGSLPTVEVDLPSATVTAAGEGPALGLQADVPAAKTDGEGWKLEKPSLKMPKADIKAPKVDISLPSVDVSLPKASVDLQAPEATLSLEGEAKTPEKEAGKTKDGKFKMPKFGMPSFGWSSSREAKGSAAADADVSLKEPQVTVASGSAEVDVSMPGAEMQVPGVEVTVETAAGGEGEKGRFKMPSVKLPKVKAPHVQVSLPKAEGSAPKAQAEVQEGEVAPQAPDVEGGLEVAAGKVEGGGMKLHMPKVKVPSVVFSKPTVKAPKVDASLPEVELKAGTGDITITAPDIQLPSVEASLELQAPETDLKASAAEAALDGAKLEATGLKGKLKMPKFDKPKFGVSLPKAEGPEGEGSLPTVEVDLPSATVTAAGEGPALGLQADVPAAKTDGEGWKLEKPSLKMPKADIKAPKVDISLPSVDVSLPKASVDLQAPEATLSLEGEAKTPEKEAGKTKDGKFKMPKFGMPSFGWSSSREVKGSAAADADVSLKEPQVTVASGSAEVDVSMPGAEMQVPGVEVTVETAAGGEGEKGRFKMPSVKLPKVKAPHVQVSLPKAEGSAPKAQAEVQEGEVAPQAPDVEGGLEVAAGKVEGGGMKLHMPKVKVPSVVFSKPTVKAPKVDASLPEVELKAGTGDITITAPDIQLPSVEASLELQAPETDLKASAAEAALDGAKLEATGLKGKLKMPKFDKPKFGVSLPKAEGPEGEGSLPTVEVDLPSATVTAAGEGPALGLQADVPAAKTDGEGWKLEKPSLKMPKADIKAPKVDISLPSVDVSLPKASVDLQAPEATLSLEGEAKTPEKEAGKTKDGKFKMPKFGMPSFGWSSSREAKGSAAADADVSLKEPQVTVASGSAEVDVSMPGAEMQVPGVEVTVETAAGGEGEKGRFKMPSVKLPKVKAPHVQVSLPKAEGSAPKAQAEVQEGEVAPQAPDVEGGLEVAAGKVEGGGMKLHMPKVKVPSVVFSKPTVKAPKVDASLPEVELKAGTGDITITAPDIQLPSVEASLELQAPETDLKASAAEAALDGAKLEATGLKGKLKMPKFDKPKFGVSLPKAEGPEGEGSLPTVEVDLPSATVTAAGEGPALGLQADVPAAKTDGEGWKLEKPSLKMPKADIKAPKVDISLPSVDVSLPKASVDLQAPEATLSLEGEAKTPEKEAGKTKDGKFKMPKFGMPSFGWSSSREAKGSAAADADVSLKEPQVTVASGSAEVDVSMPGAEMQVPGVEVTVETAAGGEGEKGRFKMPSVKLPKVKAPHVQVSLPKAEGSAPKAQAEVQEGEVAPQAPDVEGGLEVAAGKVEGGGMKLHMPKVKVPSVVFSKPTVKAPKVDASLPEVELKAGTGDITITAPDIQLPSVEASLELQAPETDLKASAAEAALDGAKLEATGLKGKLKMPKFDKPKFGVSLPKAEGPEGEGSLPTVEVDLPSATVTAAGEGPALGLQADVPAAKTDGEGWKLEKPSLKMPKADIKAPKVDISLPSVDVSLPKASVDLQAPEATLSLEGEAKTPEKEAGKTKDGKFKMPKFGMPSFGWSSSREAKGSAAADADVSLKEPQVTVASGSAEVDVSMPGAEMQVPGVEVTVETAAGGEGEKGRFKMPSVKLPKVKAPHVQVSLPKAEGSAPKAQAEVQEGEVAPQAPDVEGGLEVAAGKVEGGGMKLHMPKVKVPSVVFSKPTVKAPKVDASLPEVELKAGTGDITITAPDIQLPSVEASLELQAPETDLKASAAEAALDGAKLEATGLKGKLKMPKFDKPKFGVSLPKAEGPEGEGSLPTVEVDLPSATVTAAGEGPALGLQADVPDAKTDGEGWKLEKPSLKMPKADIKAPKVDISLPSVDVSLPKASVDLQAPEATRSLEGEAKTSEKEAGKTKDGKFKMPKFGMPSFGWSSSREAKGSAAADADVSLKEPQVTVASGSTEVDVSMPGAEIQVPGVEVTVETAAGGEGEKGRFKMPSVKLPKVKAPHVQVSLPKAEGSAPKAQAEVQEGEVAPQAPDVEGGLEVAAGKVEGGGMKLHMPKVKVPSVVFSKPTVKAPKVDASLPEVELKAGTSDITITAPDIQLPSVEASLELQAPETDLKASAAEAALDGAKLEATGLKGKLKMPKFDKPKFGVSLPKAEGPEGEGSLPTVEVDLPSATVTAAGEGLALGLQADVPAAKTDGEGWKLEKPSLKMPKADIKAPKVDISLPSVDVSLPKASVDLQAPEATLSLEGEAKTPEKEAGKTKDGKFKMPKFGMPSFGWSSSREAKGSAAADADVSLKEPQLTVASGSAEVDVSMPGAEIQAPVFQFGTHSSCEKDRDIGKYKISYFKMPKISLSTSSKGDFPSCSDFVLSEAESYAVTEESPSILSGSVFPDTKGDNIPKNMKFSIPTLGFSRGDFGSSKIEQDSPLSKLDISLTQSQMNVAESDSKMLSLSDANLSITDAGILKDHDSLEQGTTKLGGKASVTDICVSDSEVSVKIPKFRKSKFGLSWSKGKQSPSHTVCQVESEVSKGKITTDMPYKPTHISGVEFDVSIQKPSPDFVSDAPELDVSLPSMEVEMPKLEMGIHDSECKAEQEVISEEKHIEEKENKFKTPKFKLPSFSWSPKKEATAPSEAAVHIEEPTLSTLSGCKEEELTSAEKISSEIPVGDIGIKIEGPEGKTKMSKFQMSKFGITHFKGKGSEKEVSQSKSEVKFPHLKAMVDIADIAVEAPNLEVECGALTETDSPKVKMTKAGEKAPQPDVHLPSADISILKPDSDIQDSDTSLKIKGQIKQDGDGEEKEGHFKMPKFKLPSFSWSPKKEASVKPDSGATSEDHKLAVMSSTDDTEMRGAATDDKGTWPSLDLEVSTGKAEQRSPIKKPQFAMPKISLSKIKVPKSQSYSPKVDATTPKIEKESGDSILIPDIERSHSVRTEEGAQISIKLADVKIPSLEFSKTETGAPQNEKGVSSAQIDAAQLPSEASFQQVVVLKSSSTNEDSIKKSDMEFPKGEAVGELRSPEIVTESLSVVDGRKNKLEGPEGKIKMPKFQKPKFGISLTKGKGLETEIRSPKPETELPQLKMTDEVADIAVGVPASELTSDVSDSGISTCKIKAPQFLTADIEASEVDVSSQSVSEPVTEGVIENLEEKEIELKEEHEIKAEEVQTEEHQGWFKMPKFRIPAFGRTSSKEKKGDVDIERSTVKAQVGIPSAKVQTETSIPEKTLPCAVAEITTEKEEIPKSRDSVKSSDVSSSVVKGDISISTERTNVMNIAKPETYAEVVKHGAEEQKMHTSEFTVSSKAELSKPYLSASEIHKDISLTNRFPLCTVTLQEHEVKSQHTEVSKVECSTKSETSGVGCKLSSGKITLDATGEKIDSSLPKGNLDIQNQEAVIRKGKVKGEMKIIAEDSEGSQLKRPASEWSTMKESKDGGFVTAKMEDIKVEVPGVMMDVKMSRVDPEMKFQVKSVERDMSARVEVQVEDKAEKSKIKAYKFKIPKFGVLHSEVKGLEDDTNLPNSEAGSVSKTEIGTAEIKFQKSEGSIGLKSPSLDHMEASARITVETLDKSQDGPEVNIKIPKLKIPKFTFKALPTEADVSVSKVVTDPKGSSADIEVVELQAAPAIPEETPEVLEGGIQKAKSKILTLTEPDIKTAQVTTNARQDIHWSYVEGQEITEKVEPEHVAIERCEIYTTEILKESEVLSSEVKTATLGFSLIKAKLPESHSNLEVLVQQPSPTEDLSVSKPIYADESFGVAAAQTGSAEPKLPDKPHTEAKEFSGEVSLPKLKEFAVEVKLSSKVEESLPKVPEGVTACPFSKGEDLAEAPEDEDIINEKEKTDSKKSPGRFKFWLPSIGFSSSSDETSINSKTEVKKSVPEDVKPADMSDNDFSKSAEKTGWFRFPKLGFSSPTKKAKTADREEMGDKEGRISDEESPSDKPDLFFDAQESLSPKEIRESKSIETDGASSSIPVSRTIVTSSARTELILLEEEKDSQSNIPGLPAK